MKPRKQIIKQGEHGPFCARTRHTQSALHPLSFHLASAGGPTFCPGPAGVSDAVEAHAAQIERPYQPAEGAA
jgi:hypothetical protein